MGERNLNKLYIIFLTIVWLIFSEKLTLEVFLFGFTVSSILTYVNKPLLNNTKLIIKPGYYILLLKYFFILLILIIKANIQVAIIILNPNPKLDSEVIEYKTNLLSDFNKMILANSITLTPGTLTISLNDNILKVHCLESNFKKGVFDSPIENILLEIEEKYYG